VADPPSPTGVDSPTVVCADEQTDVDIDAARWAALAEAVLRTEGAIGELTLTFVDPAEIATLNAEHMGVAGPTDVLSFPLDAAGAGGQRRDGAPPVLLGDVVVCPAVAVAAAPDHGGSVDDEIALLVVHGILHVLGHDHAEPGETALMRDREIALLSELHWHGPAPATFRHGDVPTTSWHGPAPATFRHGDVPTFRQELTDP
jgi:probable rRNA maturation factor